MNAVSSAGAWHRRQARAILAGARRRYGAGWVHLSFEQRRNYCEARVLALVLAQQDQSDGHRMVVVARGVCCALEAENYRGEA